MGAIFLFLFFMWLFKGFGKAMKHVKIHFVQTNSSFKVQHIFIYSKPRGLREKTDGHFYRMNLLFLLG